MKYRTLLILIISLSTLGLSSQGVESYLDSVRIHNTGIMAITRLKEVSESAAKIGVFPPNPEVSFGYYPGKPSAIGNKTTWSITQSFDFPTSYARIKNLKKSDLNLALLESDRLIQQILTDVRSQAIGFISINIRLEIMTTRLTEMEQMRSAYSKLLDQGEVTILDFNKIDMQNISMESSVNELLREIKAMKIILDYQSGGNSDILLHSDYPVFPEPEVVKIIEEKSRVHPDFLIPVYKIEVARQKVLYSKTGGLPGISIGYGSEIVANESFTGPIVGLSVPLWENSGKVKTAKAELLYAEVSAEAELASLVAKTESQVMNVLSIKSNLNMVAGRISKMKSKELLNLALEAGEITLTDYFTELKEYYEIEDLISVLTNRYYTELSLLWDHIDTAN